MKIKAWQGILALFLLFFVFGVYSLGENGKNSDSIISINNKVDGLLNNKQFSEISNNISSSTVLIQVQKDSFQMGEQASGAVFVDEQGVVWGKGTGFSIGDGLIITASHVFDGVAENTPIKINWNGVDYINSIIGIGLDKSTDFAVVKTNLSIPPVNIIKDQRAKIGAKIGFIGYPLNERIQILHDGVISSVRNEQDGFFWYTINSFVNRGNSGGPVFLSDTGEIVGVISSRQNEQIGIPQINVDESKLSEGEKMLYQMLVFMSVQLASNSQVGIGQIVGVNQDIINNVRNDVNIKNKK